MQEQQLRTRDETPAQYKWNKESVFASDEAWDDAFSELSDMLPQVAAFQGRLGEGPALLAEVLDLTQDLRKRLGILYVYAGMSYAVDTGDQAASARQARVQGMAGRLMAALSFINPELLALGKDLLDSWLAEEPSLAIAGHFLDDLFRQQAHVRSGEVEEILGLTADPFGSAYSTYMALAESDLTFAPAIDSQGQEVEVTQSTFGGILQRDDREVRRTAWESYQDGHFAFRNTLASSLSSSMRQSVFNMRARRHATTLDMTLFNDNIPTTVFYNLIETFRRHLPTWHRYWRVRRKALGVKTLQPYDIWAPLTREVPHIPYEQAVDWVCDGLAPLGKDYVATMRRGCLEDRWIDVFPNKGKSSGAFSSGSPGTHPFIMMSYDEDAISLGTLAHETGHSMHSYLIWQNQPVLYSEYTIFAAEVASNFHQAMMRAHLFNLDLDRNLQIALIEEAMANFHRYFLVMPTLASFELDMHQRVERGEGLTADVMVGALADLVAEGYGDEVQIDRDRVGIDWATFPHLYADYYVFQYATGISAANALANRILSGTAGAVDDYLAFLRSGASMYALDSLKLAGIDMTTPEPVEETYQVLSGLIDRLRITGGLDHGSLSC